MKAQEFVLEQHEAEILDHMRSLVARINMIDNDRVRSALIDLLPNVRTVLDVQRVNQTLDQMNVAQPTQQELSEHRMVWRRNPRTGRVSMAWRCESGPRKGRTVPAVKDCSAPLNIAQAQRMKKTRAKTKLRQARRAKRTKRISPASKLLRRLNVPRRKPRRK